MQATCMKNKMKPHTCLTFPLSSLEGGGWLGTDPF